MQLRILSHFHKLTTRAAIFRFKMSTFVSQMNRITGKLEWDFRNDDYDYQQEIARSSYADMLHDTERNQMYYKALEKAVTKLRRQNKPVHVLDIGTGTGLLSMMAARLGADTVHACEAFKPMAECARKIVKKNGYGDKIKLIPKRSTDVTVGQGKDMSHRANILVTEVFDTELIGEGAIGTFTHAHRELLEKDCIVVPAVGNMYVQLVSSDFVHRWNQIDDFVVDGAQRVTSPNSISSCGGAPSLHDLQLDQLPQETFDKLTNPARVFRFDFTGRTTLPFDNTSVIDCVTLNHGRVDAVFMWWDLEMDEEGEIILSCAPRWAHPTPSDMQWRDHWMQAIYYPYSQVSVAKGDTVKVISKHDEYSLWFDVAMETCKDSSPEERPICTCGAHVTYSRSRMGMLSDPDRRNVYTNVLKKHIGSDSICLCISDGSLVPIIAAQLGAKHVYTIETNPMCNRVVREFIKHSNLQEKITILDKNPDQISNSDIDNKIDVVIGEPIFQTSLLPWDNMYFWYSLQHLTNQMTDSAVVLPGTMKIYGIAVKYENLWKIRADVGDCEEFNIQQFDSLIQYTCDKVDEVVEPQPLWEYPCQAAGDVHCLMEMDFTRTLTETLPKETHTMLNVKSNQPCNGVALWAEFNFGESHVITTGPRQPVRIGEKIDWDYYSRQGVHLFYNRNKTGSELGGNKDSSIETQVRFRPENGDLTFKFQPKWS